MIKNQYNNFWLFGLKVFSFFTEKNNYIRSCPFHFCHCITGESNESENQ